MIAACEAKTPDALQTIMDLMNSADKDSVRLQAAVFIIERAHGKAIEKSESRHGLLDNETTDNLLSMKQAIQERRQAAIGAEVSLT